MRPVIIVISLVAALALAGGWWRHQSAHSAPVNASLYETDMMEGMVREILTELPPPVPPVCFLAFGDGRTPPSRSFLERFAGSQPAMRSCGSAASPPIGRYFDVSTGREGLIIHIVSFKEYVPGTFDVMVTLSNQPAGHDRFAYRIANLGGVWVVKDRKPA